MAVVFENGSAILEDNDSYTVVGTGSNRLLLAVSIMTDGEAGGTLTTHSLNSASFTNSALFVGGTGSPYGKGARGYHLDGVAATGQYDLAISTAFINSGAFIAELSGVDQTTPIVGEEFIKDGNALVITHAAIDIPEGAFVLVVQSGVTANTPAVPDSLGATDSWTTAHADDAGLVGGGLSGGAVYYTIASADWDAEQVVANSTGTANHMMSHVVVIEPSVGGASGRIMGSIAGPGGLAGHGGIAGRSGGMAG